MHSREALTEMAHFQSCRTALCSTYIHFQNRWINTIQRESIIILQPHCYIGDVHTYNLYCILDLILVRIIKCIVAVIQFDFGPIIGPIGPIVFLKAFERNYIADVDVFLTHGKKSLETILMTRQTPMVHVFLQSSS